MYDKKNYGLNDEQCDTPFPFICEARGNYRAAEEIRCVFDDI